jgi:hypothetical protein
MQEFIDRQMQCLKYFYANCATFSAFTIIFTPLYLHPRVVSRIGKKNGTKLKRKLILKMLSIKLLCRWSLLLTTRVLSYIKQAIFWNFENWYHHINWWLHYKSFRSWSPFHQFNKKLPPLSFIDDVKSNYRIAAVELPPITSALLHTKMQ